MIRLPVGCGSGSCYSMSAYSVVKDAVADMDLDAKTVLKSCFYFALGLNLLAI